MLFIALALWIQDAHAVTVEVRGATSAQSWTRTLARSDGDTVGSVTLRALEALQASGAISRFNASDDGVVSVEEMDNRLDVISDRRMHAYGWCYHLNGREPALMPDRVPVLRDSDRIEWFWAYAVYDSGDWREMCVPAGEARP